MALLCRQCQSRVAVRECWPNCAVCGGISADPIHKLADDPAPLSNTNPVVAELRAIRESIDKHRETTERAAKLQVYCAITKQYELDESGAWDCVEHAWLATAPAKEDK